jgi:hypothetical protein
MARSNDELFLPALIERAGRSWTNIEVEVKESAVNLESRVAYVPRALTEAQKLARLHELGHVKYTPRNWIQNISAIVAEADDTVDPLKVLDISKMLEENRIDWLLWDLHGVDLRPAREVLDWSSMPVPTDPLDALHWVLQLGWTVWASDTIRKIPRRPPQRSVDYSTRLFFDNCIGVVARYSRDLMKATVAGCLRMYEEPTDDMRNRVALDLATFFPRKEKEFEPPPEKAGEQARRKEAEVEAHRREVIEGSLDLSGSGEKTSLGAEIHDHTPNIRRRSMKIKKQYTPTFIGTRLVYPQRYMIDKAVFAHRTQTSGGLMIDGSQSMHWSNANLQEVMAKLPEVTVGAYYGYEEPDRSGREHRRGRICILARDGRYSEFTGWDKGWTGDNMADVEALKLLASWPKPRFWLSDGRACGGQFDGPHPDQRLKAMGPPDSFIIRHGNIVYLCDELMRRHEIYRVPNAETLIQLLNKKRVTLFRSCSNGGKWFNNMPAQPVSYQL